MSKAPPANPSVPAPRRRPAWQRWALRFGLVFLAYTLLGFLILPLLVRSLAPGQFKNLLDRQGVIQQVRFNPFTFVAEVNGLAITDPDGEPLLTWQQLRVDFEFTSLFRGPWRIREISLVQPTVRAQVNPDYRFNFSDLLDNYSTASEAPPSAPQPMPPLVIDALRIQEAALIYADLTTSTPFRRRVGPVHLRVPDFSTLPGHTNTFELLGSTDAAEQFSFTGSLLLTPPEIAGRFDLHGLNVTNFTPFYQDFLRVQLRDGSIALSGEPLVRFSPTNRLAQLANTRFALQGLKVGLPDAPANLVELDNLSVDVSSADAPQRDAHVRNVLIDGVRLQVHRRADRSFELLEATKPTETTNTPPASALLVVSAFKNAMAAFSGQTNVGLARLDALLLTNTTVNLLDETPRQPVRLNLSEITASLRNLSTLPDAAPATRLSLLWQTNGPLTLEAQAQINPPTLDVSIDLERWDLSFADPYLANFANAHLTQSELAFTGRAHLEAPPGVEPSGTFDGSVHLTHLRTSHAAHDDDLLHWDAFRIHGIHANLNPPDVAIDQIELARPELWATLLADGTVNLLTAANITNAVMGPSASSAAPPPDTPVPSDPTSPRASAETEAPIPLPPVHITSILLTNAVLHLTDQLTEPDAHLTINPLNGEARDLSSTNLQKADFQFSGQFEPMGSFNLQGQMRPLDGPDTTRFDLTTQGIDLTPTSPYIQRFLGYELDRGAINTELSYRVTQRQIQGENHVVLDRFTLGQKVDSPEAFDVPIKLGLKVLQDRQGKIDLSVPVEGSLDDPQFDLAKVIRGAFANVFTKVLTSPFSLLGGMFGGGEDEDLQRLEFMPGQVTLAPDALSRAGTLEKILYARPSLGLELTGTANPAKDGKALKETRLLAQLRALPTAPDSTNTLTRADNDRLIAQAYCAAKGITLSTNPAAAPRPEPAPPESTVPTNAAPPEIAAAVNLRPKPRVPGGALMMRNRLNQATAVPPEPPVEATPPPPTAPEPPVEASVEPQPTLPPVDTMRQFLLDSIEVTPADLSQLAGQRAEAVRTAILESGRVEPQRIVIRNLTGPPPSGTDVRLSLQ